MSIEKNFYIGILLYIPSKTETRQIYSHNECSKCSYKGIGKFCPKCGNLTEIIYIDKFFDINVGYILISNGFDEDLIYKPDNDCDCFLPNKYKYNLLKKDELYIFDKDFNKQKYIDQYIDENKEMISILENVFGNIIIDFGFLSYWS